MKVINNPILLSDIIKHRMMDIQKEIELKPLEILKEEAESYNKSNLKSDSRSSDGKATNNFRQSLDIGQDVAVIYEFKPASPSMGDISSSSLEDALEVFEESGASAVSILTEERYFKGSLGNIKSAYNITKLPIIRKDFIIDDYQVYEAKVIGADAILLIAAILDDSTFKHLYDLAYSLGLDVLCEVHDEEEMRRMLDMDVKIIGINNRNLKTFVVSLDTTKKLVEMVSKGKILVSESGVTTEDDVIILKESNVNALLIGTAFMESENPEELAHSWRSIYNVK